MQDAREGRQSGDAPSSVMTWNDMHSISGAMDHTRYVMQGAYAVDVIERLHTCSTYE